MTQHFIAARRGFVAPPGRPVVGVSGPPGTRYVPDARRALGFASYDEADAYAKANVRSYYVVLTPSME